MSLDWPAATMIEQAGRSLGKKAQARRIDKTGRWVEAVKRREPAGRRKTAKDKNPRSVAASDKSGQVVRKAQVHGSGTPG